MNSKQESIVDTSVNLHIIISMTFRKWYLILGIVIISCIVATALNVLTYKPKYVAESLVQLEQIDYAVLTGTSISVDFSRSEISIETLERYAISDQIILELTGELSTLYDEYADIDLSEFRENLSTTLFINVQTLLGLRVTHEDPTRSAEIANIWAEIVVRDANLLFANYDKTRLQTQKEYRDQLLDEIADLQTLIERLPTDSPELLTRTTELNAKSALYESILVSIGYTEAGLDQRFEAQIASQTSTPTQPTPRRLVLTLILTGFSSSIVAFLVIFLYVIWKSEASYTT